MIKFQPVTLNLAFEILKFLLCQPSILEERGSNNSTCTFLTSNVQLDCQTKKQSTKLAQPRSNSYESLPDKKRALSTVVSSANRMWQKFFLLLRIAVISPHCPKTSMMSCSVAFSGKPPTNTVLQPGGRSLVAGGGRSVQSENIKSVNVENVIYAGFLQCVVPGVRLEHFQATSSSLFFRKLDLKTNPTCTAT